jgi:hypothetical protein
MLKETVERGIGMQQDWIQFYDCQGTKLLTDEEVSTAVSEGRAPIHATVSDHSVHNFEQRREEFAHMQWKVMRDQFTVLSLQLGHTQQQLRNMQEEATANQNETVRTITTMKNQLAEGLHVVTECKGHSTHMEGLIKTLDENVHNMGLQVSEEAMKRDTAMQDVQFKMDRQNTAQQHESARLAEAFDSCLNLLQETDGQLGQDIHSLQQKIEATRDLAYANQEEALKQVAEARTIANRAMSDASFAWLKQAHDDAEKQVNQLANMLATFETRIVKSESLASDTANRWLASHEQLKVQYNSVSQAVEQCRLQNRTNQASTQEVRDKLGMQADAMQAQTTSMKAEQARERKDRQEQLKNMQQNLDGTLKSTMAELESKLSNRVDQEADARTTSILQAIDDIGTVLEKQIPTKVRHQSRPEYSYLSNGIQSPIKTPRQIQTTPRNGTSVPITVKGMSQAGYVSGSTTQARPVYVNGATGASNGIY